MEHEKWVSSGGALAVRSCLRSDELLAPFVRSGGGDDDHLDCVRQGTASVVPRGLGPSGVSTPEARVLAATIYSTHNSRGREPHFRTLSLTDPSKPKQVRVD
jgi:hypothetical protein